MVRQLVISNMIKGMMPKQAPKQVKSMQPMQRISASFQPLFVCKSWLTKSNTMKTKNWLICTWTLMPKRQMATSSVNCLQLWLIQPMQTLLKRFWQSGRKGCCETTRLGNELVFHLLTPWVHSRICLDLGAWKLEWVKAALGGDMSFDKFVIYPANTFKTAERLAEFKAFFELQLSDMAISRNISMGIKEIAARVDLIQREKKQQ